jgi:hypothetical protein
VGPAFRAEVWDARGSAGSCTSTFRPTNSATFYPNSVSDCLTVLKPAANACLAPSMFMAISAVLPEVDELE